jgi:Zn-dependent M28 family amino/carboxypeptidase
MLLTLAQTFTRIAESPKRSLIFLASTGEELGIVGTPYFVEHPTIPLENIVAAINIDGPSFLVNPVTRVLAMGASNSNLDGVVDASTTLLGLELEKAAAPLNYSDHYPFVNKGIPSL